MATSTGRPFHHCFGCTRPMSTMTVAMDPGPASSGMASGTMATSSFTWPSSTSGAVMRAGEGAVRIMSMAMSKQEDARPPS